MTRKIEAVIFDLDGTLADTFPLIVRAFNDAVSPYTGKTYSDAEVISRFGEPEPTMIRMDVPEKWREAAEAFYESYRANHAAMVRAFDGVETMLAAVKAMGLPMGLVTGKSRRSAMITVEALGWKGDFAAIVTGDDMHTQKPHPCGPLLAAKLLGKRAESCAMIGDSPADIGAGKAAGMLTIAAVWQPVYEGKLREIGADYFARRPGDVVGMLG